MKRSFFILVYVCTTFLSLGQINNPEGGYLIAGQSCAVAFKALSSDGQPVEMQGEIFDEQDNLITECAAMHEGMGRFSLTPEANKCYYALCRKNNQSIKVKLPEVKTDAYALATVWRQNKLCDFRHRRLSRPFKA